MILLRTPFAYAKVHKVDPDEARHRKAQFLIHKVLEEHSCGTKRSALARRVQRFKAKIGVRMKRFRLNVRRIRLCIYRRMAKHLKNLKKLVHGKESP